MSTILLRDGKPQPSYDIFDGIEEKYSEYDGFAHRLLCVKNTPPRAPEYEYLLFIGINHIEALFDDRHNPPTILDEVLTFIFPERFLSVHEQQCLFAAITKADTPNLKRVDIVTSSPMVVQCSNNCYVTAPDDRYYYSPDRDAYWAVDFPPST